MRFVACVVVISVLSRNCNCAPVSGLADCPTSLSVLEAKADQAQPKDRCYLYAVLVSRMADLAGEQLNSGDSAKASETLKRVKHLAEKMQLGTPDDSKRLKNAELLMQRTSFRLLSILHGASYENRPALEATLKELNQVQEQLMMQVFKK